MYASKKPASHQFTMENVYANHLTERLANNIENETNFKWRMIFFTPALLIFLVEFLCRLPQIKNPYKSLIFYDT